MDLRGGKGYKGTGKGYDKGGDYAGHDNFPAWYFKKPEGANQGITALDREDYENAKVDLYKLCEWDEDTGAPTRRSLEKHDLNDVADALEKMGLLPG